MSLADRLIENIDQALRTSFGSVGTSKRPSPVDNSRDLEALSDDDRKLAGRLMRVNHCGEVCAQALYHGQALTAKNKQVANSLTEAAEEETDHLAWCEKRLKELETPVSHLNPLWYGSSFAMGAVAGLLGDKVNLGFVAATEEQVCKHLDEHIEKLPTEDARSRIILEAMREDEKRHELHALESGGTKFSPAVKHLMTGVSKLMTRTSFWI